MIRQIALRENAGCLARIWSSYKAPKKLEEYVYIEGMWAKVTVEWDYNGHEHQAVPQRRESDTLEKQRQQLRKDVKDA